MTELTLNKEIEHYKNIMFDISDFFLKYLLLKKQQKVFGKSYLENVMQPLYLKMKFSRYKLFYGDDFMKYSIDQNTKDDWHLWQNVNQHINTIQREKDLIQLEKLVFGAVKIYSPKNWNRVFQELR